MTSALGYGLYILRLWPLCFHSQPADGSLLPHSSPPLSSSSIHPISGGPPLSAHKGPGISPGNCLVDEKYSNCCGHELVSLSFLSVSKLPTIISGLHFTIISSQDRKSEEANVTAVYDGFPNAERTTINKLSGGGSPRLRQRVISFKRGNKVN